MNINIYGKGLELTDALREEIREQFKKLSRYHTGTYSVTLEVRNNEHIADAVVHVSGHNDIYSVGKSDDMYNSIGILSKKLDQRLSKIDSINKNKNHRSLVSGLSDEE